MIKRSGAGFRFQMKNLHWFILRSLAGTLGIFCNFYAVDHLVLSDASTLNKLSPFFVIVFSYLILREKITVFQLTCITSAFIGSMFIVKPSFAAVSVLPALIGFLGGMFAGCAYACVRKLGTRGERGPFIVFFFSTFSCISCIPFMIGNFHPISGLQLVYLLLAGLAAAGGQFAITAAYTYAPGKEISIYDYLFNSAGAFSVRADARRVQYPWICDHYHGSRCHVFLQQPQEQNRIISYFEGKFSDFGRLPFFYSK